MQCLSPITIKNPRFGLFKDEYQFIKVPCGKCEACSVNKQTAWFIRLKEEMKVSSKTYFFTLTYEDSHTDFNLNKEDIQLFIKRLREDLRKDNISLKYYLVGEYGPQTFRPHYHGLFFISSHKISNFSNFPDKIEKHWNKGFIQVDENVSDARIKYVSGYFISKLWSPPDKTPCFTLCSKSLGKSYITDENISFHNTDYHNKFYYPVFDKRLPLPRYYKERLFSRSQCSQFSKDCEQRSSDKYDSDLSNFSNDIHRLEKFYSDIRKNYACYVRRHHKKVKL